MDAANRALKAGTRVSLRWNGGYRTAVVVGRTLGCRPDDDRYDVRIEKPNGRLSAPVRGCVVYQCSPSAENWEEVAR